MQLKRSSRRLLKWLVGLGFIGVAFITIFAHPIQTAKAETDSFQSQVSTPTPITCSDNTQCGQEYNIAATFSCSPSSATDYNISCSDTLSPTGLPSLTGKNVYVENITGSAQVSGESPSLNVTFFGVTAGPLTCTHPNSSDYAYEQCIENFSGQPTNYTQSSISASGGGNSNIPDYGGAGGGAGYNLTVCPSAYTAGDGTCTKKGSSPPSGSLSANPNPCTGAASSSCNSTISWTTSNVTAAQVFVNGSPFAAGTSGSQDDPAVPVGGSVTFDLYDYSSGSPGALLSSITVSGDPAPINGVCASPPNGGSYASAPPGPYCTAGTFSGLSGSGPWTWTCNGEFGGASASCNAGTTSSGSCMMSPVTDFFTGTQGDGKSYSESVFVGNTSPSPVTATPQVSGAPSWFSISPASASIPPGGSATFTVTVTTGSLLPNTYNYTFNTALSGGTTASCNTNVGSAVTFLVSPSTATVTSVTVKAINPPSGVINIGQTAQYQAIEHFSDGSTLDITGVAPWSSSSTAIATYVGGTGSNPPGTFQGISPGGPINVTACSPSDSGICGSATITVNAAPVVCNPLTPNPTTGNPVTFEAAGGDGTYAWSAPKGAPASGSGSGFTTEYAAPGTYSVQVTSGATNDSCLVTVSKPAPPPSCAYFTSSPSRIVVPAHSQLAWSCTNVSTCSITDAQGSVGGPYPTATGSESSTLAVSPASTTQYTLTCHGIGGGASATSSITTVSVQGTGVQETNPGH
jgi:hypothetical protein